MNTTLKSVMSVGMLALFGITITCDASAESTRSDRHTNEQIQSCVAEISENANYGDASRVVHWIAKLHQKNPVEMEVRVKTAVYVEDGSDDVREYSTSCVTGALGKLVRFRINPVEG